jgi:peptidoglycan hydrolase-like protein with peptidoglycan-binding domain
MMRRTALALSLVLVASACGGGDDTGSDPAGGDGGGTSGPPEGVTVVVADQAVLNFQEALDIVGYDPGPIDGVYRERTTKAVQAFQADNSLAPSGDLDAETTRALFNADPRVEPLVIGAIQTALTELGYDVGIIDGVWGPATQGAIAALQDEGGLEASGEVTDDTWELLRERYNTEVVATALDASGYSDLTAAAAPDETEGLLRQGDEGEEVQAVQQRLLALGYQPGEPDGRYGGQTASAVMAFQKHEGLQRDGVTGAEVLSHLDNPTGAGPRADLTGPRVEVDLDRQILFLVDEQGAVSILNISSGSGKTYKKPDGGESIAYTPTGDFVVERRVDGLREAALGSLYRPLYFDRGWAIHGSSSVPGYPASHGCVRTSNADQDYIFPRLPEDAPIVIYGHSPGQPTDEAGF